LSMGALRAIVLVGRQRTLAPIAECNHFVCQLAGELFAGVSLRVRYDHGKCVFITRVLVWGGVSRVCLFDRHDARDVRLQYACAALSMRVPVR